MRSRFRGKWDRASVVRAMHGLYADCVSLARKWMHGGMSVSGLGVDGFEASTNELILAIGEVFREGLTCAQAIMRGGWLRGARVWWR